MKTTTHADWGSLFDPMQMLIAFLVVGIVVFISLQQKPTTKLEGRLRSILEGHDADDSIGRSGGVFKWISNKLQLDAARQKLQDWVLEKSPIGVQRRALLKRAGLRSPRSYLYFEVARVVIAVALAVSVFLFVDGNRALSRSWLSTYSFTFLAFMLGLYLPEFYLKQRIAARQKEFSAFWDDAIGLLIICLDAGLSIEVAMRRIAQELAATAPVLAEEFVITVSDLSLLRERRMAYQALAERMDLPGVKAIVIALVQAEKQGASISNSLRAIWAVNRQARLTAAEAKAAALGPKMTVPMIIFFLPVVFVVIISPIVLTANF